MTGSIRERNRRQRRLPRAPTQDGDGNHRLTGGVVTRYHTRLPGASYGPMLLGFKIGRIDFLTPDA